MEIELRCQMRPQIPRLKPQFEAVDECLNPY